MKNLPLLLFALALVFSATELTAQTVPQKAVFTISLSDSTVTPGDTIEVSFIGKITDGSVVYDQSDCEVGPIAPSFSFDESSSYKLIGEPIAIGTKEFYDDIFQCNVNKFEKAIQWKQKLVVQSQDVSISGNIEYQVCNETSGLCIMYTYKFDTKL